MSKTSIKDTAVYVKPSAALCAYIAGLHDVTEMPENVRNVHQLHGGTSATAISLCSSGQQRVKPALSDADVEWLQQLNVAAAGSAATESDDTIPVRLADIVAIDTADTSDEDLSDEEAVDDVATGKAPSKTRAKKMREQRRERQKARLRLTLQDLLWLNELLGQRRQRDADANADADADADDRPAVYLHTLLAGSKLSLPRNEIHRRDPVLEARCVRLRLEQDARVYNAMTKNVDTSRRQLPDETIAYQMKAINRQMIAVAQFLFSVAAGFAFGFIGVELLIGNLDFGFRLLLGIICALVIALAEIYFLAKQLNEEYDISVAADKVVLKAPGDVDGAAAVKATGNSALTPKPIPGDRKKAHAD